MSAESSVPHNVVWQAHEVDRAQRELVLGQSGRLIWLTGLSGSGKSTIASRLDAILNANGRATYLLDGDNVRHGLCSDLGFTEEDRRENLRRIAEVGKLFVDAGIITIAAFVSPNRRDRNMVRNLLPAQDYIEVYVSTPLEVCEERDPKGLYKRARAGQIPNFTGISAPYEPPDHAEIVVNTAEVEVDDAVVRILSYLESLAPGAD